MIGRKMVPCIIVVLISYACMNVWVYLALALLRTQFCYLFVLFVYFLFFFLLSFWDNTSYSYCSPRVHLDLLKRSRSDLTRISQMAPDECSFSYCITASTGNNACLDRLTIDFDWLLLYHGPLPYGFMIIWGKNWTFYLRILAVLQWPHWASHATPSLASWFYFQAK